MSHDLIPTDGDGFDVPEPRTGFIIGSMVKFIERDFFADKTEKLPEGTTLVVTGVVTAWVKWEDGKPEHRVTHAGQAHPQRDDLPDQDESLWEIDEKFTGEPRDPWKDARYVYQIDPRTGRDFTFVTDTFGSRAAVGELKNAIANVRRAHPGVVPLVKLGWKMMPTRRGPRPRPVFEVIEWRGGSNDGPVGPIEGSNNKRGAIEHRKEEVKASGGGAPFDDEIPFTPEWR
jgi:hypothetical protein